ncbi:MAG: hypothetical protein Roseis2KO_00480 [Roseivirga sp.]
MKRLSYLVVMLLIIVASSCSDNDEPSPNEIVGTWESVEAIGNSQFYQSLVFSFKADNSYEAMRITGLQDTGEDTGFMYRERGTYALNGSTLRLISTDISIHSGSSISSPTLEDLVPTGHTRDELVEFSFDNDKTELTLDYADCGPADNCIDKHTFAKGRVF